MHLADEHTMFREGLRAILCSREGIEVVRKALMEERIGIHEITRTEGDGSGSDGS